MYPSTAKKPLTKMQFSLYQKDIIREDSKIVSWSTNRRLNEWWGKVFICSLLMIKYCWFWFCLPACRERVFDWLIKNENWWPEFILNRCWGLSKDLHNFHQPNTFTGKSEVEIKQYHQDHYYYIKRVIKSMIQWNFLKIMRIFTRVLPFKPLHLLLRNWIYW